MPGVQTASPTVTITPDRCPRCGGEFACGMGGATPCPCTTLELPVELQRALATRYVGCLCLSCLAAEAAVWASEANIGDRPSAAPPDGPDAGRTG